jgi:hypothetical protein
MIRAAGKDSLCTRVGSLKAVQGVVLASKRILREAPGDKCP